MLERSTLRCLGVLALFCGSTALAGSESAAPGKVESIETSVCRLIELSARTQSAGRVPDTADLAGKQLSTRHDQSSRRARHRAIHAEDG